MVYAFLLAQTVDIIIYVLIIMLFIRILMSFFIAEGSPLEQFLSMFTEPFVYPMRNALAKSEFFSSIPVDYSLQFTLFALILIDFILMLF